MAGSRCTLVIVALILYSTSNVATASQRKLSLFTLPEDLLNAFEHVVDNCGMQDDGGCCTGLGVHYCRELNKCVSPDECPQPDECCLFEHVDFQGKSVCFRGDSDIDSPAIDLRHHQFNDRTSSIRCTGDTFIAAYADTQATGDFRLFTGSIPDLRQSSGGLDECIVRVHPTEVDPNTGFSRIYYVGPRKSLSTLHQFTDPLLRPDGLNDRITSVIVRNGARGLALAKPMYAYLDDESGTVIGQLFGANSGTSIPAASRCGRIPFRAPYDCGLSELLARQRESGSRRRQLKLAGAAAAAAYAASVQAEIWNRVAAGECGTVPSRFTVGESCTGGNNRWCLQSIFGK